MGEWKLDKETMEKSAWYAGNSNHVTHPIAQKLPNKLGLYDMLGNVGEWATDSAGKPVLCGGTFRDGPEGINPETTAAIGRPSGKKRIPKSPKAAGGSPTAPSSVSASSANLDPTTRALCAQFPWEVHVGRP